MNVCAVALVAASSIWPRVASVPKAMLSATVPANITVSGRTSPTWRRTQFARAVPDIPTVDVDATGGRVVEAGQECGEGRLSCAGPSDDRDVLTGPDVKGDVVERERVGVVGEAHIVEVEDSLTACAVVCPRHLDELVVSRQHRRDALTAGRCVQHPGALLADPRMRG